MKKATEGKIKARFNKWLDEEERNGRKTSTERKVRMFLDISFHEMADEKAEFCGTCFTGQLSGV
jgi:hypothetical protein